MDLRLETVAHHFNIGKMGMNTDLNVYERINSINFFFISRKNYEPLFIYLLNKVVD